MSSLTQNNNVTTSGSQKIAKKLSKSKQFDYTFKIVMIGDSGVGKSCILLRFADDKFNENFYATIGVDFRFKNVMVDDKSVKLQIWDTAGQERYKSITNAYYKGSKGAFVVYDITRKETFDNVDKWINELRIINGNKILIILIGNKSDLNLLRKINAGEANFKANQLGINFFEVSALDSSNIHKAFEEMIKEIYVRTKLGGGTFDYSFPLNKNNSLSQLGKTNEDKCNC
jgi:small GTP-binding protein